MLLAAWTQALFFFPPPLSFQVFVALFTGCHGQHWGLRFPFCSLLQELEDAFYLFCLFWKYGLFGVLSLQASLLHEKKNEASRFWAELWGIFMCLFRSFDSYQLCMSRTISRWFQQSWSCLRVGEWAKQSSKVWKFMSFSLFEDSSPHSKCFPGYSFKCRQHKPPPPSASSHPTTQSVSTSSSLERGGSSVPFGHQTSPWIQGGTFSARSQGKGLRTKPASYRE